MAVGGNKRDYIWKSPLPYFQLPHKEIAVNLMYYEPEKPKVWQLTLEKSLRAFNKVKL